MILCLARLVTDYGRTFLSSRIGSLLKGAFAAFGVHLRHPRTKASNCGLIALHQFSMIIGQVFAQVRSQLRAQVLLIMCFAKGTSLTLPSVLRKELEPGTTGKPKETAILGTMIIHYPIRQNRYHLIARGNSLESFLRHLRNSPVFRNIT